jgi:hypothetical protein
LDQRHQSLGMAAADDFVPLVQQPIALDQRDRAGCL